MFKLIFLFCLMIFSLNAKDKINIIEFRDDDSILRVSSPLNPNSHIKVFIPSIPYSYIAKNTNSALLRSFDNKRTWQYDLAKNMEQLDDYTYIFQLRKNLRFQDGSSFSVDSVINNLRYFKKYPFLYTNIDKIDFTVEKISLYKFKIKLKQKYEMFLNDLARIFFYTDEYLKKFQPKGAETGSANIAAGPYGMGPYILKEGFARGEQQTHKLELLANPYYWNKNIPKINRVTVYTQLDVNTAIKNITRYEKKLDLMPLPFNKKIDVILSKYAKLQSKKSTNNFLIFFNLINGNQKIKNQNIRLALNQALNQENLKTFVYKNEGKVSAFTASINYKIVNEIAKENSYISNVFTEDELKNMLNGLSLDVLTQDRFMFLWKGIEFQLKKYGVKLKYKITTSEKDIYSQLLTTNKNKNTKKWDMLIWGDDDWYYQDPWTVFFIYEPGSAWFTLGKDEIMASYIKEYFITKRDTKAYKNITRKILYRAKDMAYTLRVPSPNNVIALNKEVIYKPYIGGMIPLWDIQITKDHWSIRGKKQYPKELLLPIKVKR